MKTDHYVQKSYWKICPVCMEEFRTMKAEKCRDCLNKEYRNKKNAKTE